MQGPFYKSVASVGFANVTAAITIAGMNFALAAMLTPVAYGHFSLIFAIVSILILTGRLGMQTVIVRFGTEYLHKKELANFSVLSRTTLSVVLTGSFFSAIAAYIYLLAWGRIGGTATIAFACSIILYSVSGWCQGAIEARGRFGLAIYVCRVLPFALCTGFVATKFFASGAISLWDTAIGLLVGFSCSILISIAFVCRGLMKENSNAETPTSTREWIYLGLSVMLVGLLQTFSRFLDIFILDYFRTAEEVAVYALTARISEIVAFGVAASNIVVASALARVDRIDEKALTPIFAKAFYATFGVAALMSAAVIPGFVIVLPFFSDAYSLALEPLMILVGGQVIAAFCGPVLFIFVSLGYKKELVRFAGFGLVLNFMISVMLVPEFGVVGAAIATSSGIIFLALSLFMRLSMLVGTTPPKAAWLTAMIGRDR